MNIKINNFYWVLFLAPFLLNAQETPQPDNLGESLDISTNSLNSGAQNQKELDQLQELSKKNAALVQELGTISLAEINLDERKEKAEGFLAEVRQEEVDLVKELEDKYGVGSIDLKAGEFIPAPEAPEAKEEAPAAPEVVEE